MFARSAAEKKDADVYLKHLQEQFTKHNPDYPVIHKSISIKDTAEMAELLPAYEYSYRIYCKFTHSAMRAVEGNLNQKTDLFDTPTIVWCVLFMLKQLKQHTPAEIPDLDVFDGRVTLLDAELSQHPPTSRVDTS